MGVDVGVVVDLVVDFVVVVVVDVLGVVVFDVIDMLHILGDIIAVTLDTINTFTTSNNAFDRIDLGLVGLVKGDRVGRRGGVVVVRGEARVNAGSGVGGWGDGVGVDEDGVGVGGGAGTCRAVILHSWSNR